MANPNGNPENLMPPFTSENQPSSEAKSKGWERRREAQKILDEFMRKGEMTYQELEDLLADVKAHPENHTVREVKIAKYIKDSKYTIDWLDRHVSKAPTEIDQKLSGSITVNDIMNQFEDPDNLIEKNSEEKTSGTILHQEQAGTESKVPDEQSPEAL